MWQILCSLVRWIQCGLALTSRVLVVFKVYSRGRNQMGLCPVFIWQCWRYEGLNVKVTSLVLSRERISDIHRIPRITVQMDHVSWSEMNDGQPLSAGVCASVGRAVPRHPCWLLLSPHVEEGALTFPNIWDMGPYCYYGLHGWYLLKLLGVAVACLAAWNP